MTHSVAPGMHHLPAPQPFQGPSGTPPAGDRLLSDNQRLELLEYWRSITKRKWAILALGAAAAVVAAVVAMALVPIYQAPATVLIEAGKAKILSFDEVYGGASQQREHYQTQIEIIKSRDVATRTVRAMKLWEHPYFDPRNPKPGWSQQLQSSLGIGKTASPREWTEEELVANTAKRVMGGLSVTPVRASQLVRVAFESPDRELSAKVANAVAAQYIEADRDERYKLTNQVSQQLQERMVQLRQKLAQSERALQDYRDKKGIVSLGGSAQAATGQQVTGFTERLLQARARRIELESSYLQAKAAKPGAYSSVPAVLRDTGVVDAQKLVSAADAKVQDLLLRLGTEHMQVKQAQAELANLKDNLQQRELAVVAAMTKEYEAARSSELALERSLGDARGAAQGVNREEFQLAVLEREYQSNRQLYDVFMNRAKETNLTGDVQASVARITDAAVPPDVPIKPNKSNIVQTTALIAILLGALASVALDRLDNTIKGGDDAEVRLKLPVLSALPDVPKVDRQHMGRLFVESPHSHFSEGIRTARTGVQLSNLDVAHKILLVTSTLPGEGKTTVAINLAVAHAQTKKTLLIDCDMRRAQVTRTFGVPAGTPGLTNLVAGTAPASKCIFLQNATGLYVLPVGDMPPNPLDVLLSNRFKEVLKDLNEQYDMIIIDSPPVELVSEALVLSPLATSTAMVVKAMSTPAPLVRKSIARLQRAGGNILGVVVNRLDFAHAQRYYGEYGSSSYAYGSYGYNAYVGDKTRKAKSLKADVPAAQA